MSAKTPIRGVFDSGTAERFAEFQSGEYIALTHGGLGAFIYWFSRTSIKSKFRWSAFRVW